jgi:hypothetical protein
VLSSDLPGVNPATLNGMIRYYRLMTKRSGLGDSTKLSRVVFSHSSTSRLCPNEDVLAIKAKFAREFWLASGKETSKRIACAKLQ